MNSKKKLILALETGIEGGSVSIWDYRFGIEVGSLIGDKRVSKSEDILKNLDILIEKYSIDKKDFDSVVFAMGIGSSTGLKIGEATAKGLAKSFGCRYREASLLDVLAAAMLKKDSSSKNKKFYLPAGKGRIMIHRYQQNHFSSDVENINFNEFQTNLQNSMEEDCLVYEGVVEKLSFVGDVICIRRNLAGYLSEIASDNNRN